MAAMTVFRQRDSSQLSIGCFFVCVILLDDANFGSEAAYVEIAYEDLVVAKVITNYEARHLGVHHPV